MTDLQSHKAPTLRALRLALRSPTAIGVLAQEGADDPDRLALLSHTRSDEGELPVAGLEEYSLCIKYAEELEPKLARFALPMCLDAWQRCLFRGEHPGLARMFFDGIAGRTNKIERSLGTDGACLIRDFMRRSILFKLSAIESLGVSAPEEMEIWVDFIACYGTAWTDVAALLGEWSAVTNLGFALSSVQYLSLLVYNDAEHPIFGKWAGQRGGAAPLPWSGKDAPWLHENVVALEKLLLGDGALAWLSRAVARLAGQPDESLARTILEDLELQPYRFETRCKDLIAHMATSGAQKYWSDDYGMNAEGHRGSI